MNSKYIYFIKRLFYYFYGEKFFKRLNYQWKNYPSRFEIIQKLINLNIHHSYLEIGCDQDENFSKINVKRKVGVDPKSGGTYKMTSDFFFSQNKENFDFIFIDGLHTYEQVKKDIANSLKILNQRGIIAIHDCLPNKIWNQIVPRLYGHWNGDVWKAIVEVRTFKDIDCYTCIADHGLGILIKRPNRNILSLEIKNFKNLKFRDYYIHHQKFMNLIEAKDIEKILK